MSPVQSVNHVAGSSKLLQGGMLAERRRYDDYGRLEYVQDTQQRWFRVFRSPRDAVTRVHASASQFGPALWYQWFERDAFGRGLKEYTNGITAAELTSEVQRRPGGQVWWSRKYGERPTFSTTNADGEVVWSMDAAEETSTVATSMPSSREVTSSTVRLTNWLTTSTVTQLDVLGLPTTVRSDGAGNGRTPFSRATSYTRNRSGALLHQDDPDGKATEFEVDLAGRVTAVRESVPTNPPTQLSSFFIRDRRGAVETATDLNSELTRHVYNSFGQPVRRESPGRSGTLVAEWSYDALGRVNVVTPGAGISYQHQYNNKNQLTAFVISDNQILRSWTRDSLGRLLTATNKNVGLSAQTGEVVVNTFAYDWLGRVATETSQVGGRALRTTTSTFGVNGSLPWQPVTRTTTRPDAMTTVDEFDSLGRQSRLTRGSATTDFIWTADLMTEQTSLAASSFVQTLVNFDSLGQPLSWATQVNGANVLQVDVLRDAAGRVGTAWRQDWRPPGVTTPAHSWRGYTYDSMRRVQRLYEKNAQPNLTGLQTHTLTAQQVEGIAQGMGAETWSYEREPKVGSVLSITTTGGKERLLASPRLAGYQLSDYRRTSNEQARVVGHDSVGRVTSDGIDGYTWSHLSELRKAGAEQLQYDGLGRLVARLNLAGDVLEEYTYDGAQMVAAFGPSQNLVWSATWGPGLDKLVSIKRGDATYLALGDGRGSIGTYVNELTRRVAATLDYTPEGRVAWRTWDGNGAQVGECDQVTDPELDCHVGPEELPFGFHGAFKSPGTGLVYFRNRWLSTRTGEWLSQDPLGAVDSSNLYAFNAFDAVNRLDLLGLKSTGPAVNTVVFEAEVVEGEVLLKGNTGPGRGMVTPARASSETIEDAKAFYAELEAGFEEYGKFYLGVAAGTIEGATPGASAVPGPPITQGPRSFAIGRAVGNILGGLIDLLAAAGTGGGGVLGAPETGGASAVVGLEVASVLVVNGSVSMGRGASALIDLAVQSANNGGKGPPGAQTSAPPAAAPTAPAPSPASGSGAAPSSPANAPASQSPGPSLGRATVGAENVKFTKDMNSKAQPIARGDRIDKVEKLVEQFGGPAKDWSKMKTWDSNGREIHYYSHPVHGKVGIKLAGEADPF